MNMHVRKAISRAVRSVGDMLETMGCNLEAHAHIERLHPTTRRVAFKKDVPDMKCVFVAPSASVIGKVTIGEFSSVWYNAVVRGDVNSITIGDAVSIGERAMIHCSSPETLNSPTKIGSRVVIGVGANIHGCTLEDECYIGEMSTVLDGAVVGKHSVIAPGSVVTSGTTVPSRQLWSGVPAKYERDLSTEEISKIGYEVSDAAEWASLHAEEVAKDKDGFQILREFDEYDYADCDNKGGHTNRTKNPMYRGHLGPGTIFDHNLRPEQYVDPDNRHNSFHVSIEDDNEQVRRNFGLPPKNSSKVNSGNETEK